MRGRVLVAIVVISFAAVGAAYAQSSLVGSFALQSGVAKTTAHLVAVPAGKTPSTWNLDFWLTEKNKRAAITAYDLDMTKPMHLIVVSADFRTFMHEHPSYKPDGHFMIKQTFPTTGTYYAYYDGQPTGFGQQVFRFNVDAGGRQAVASPDLSERSRVARAGDYSVAISGLSLHAGSETNIVVHITKAGKPATDLHPYLQALAHAVLIDADDLSYIHVHPVMLSEGAQPMSRVMAYASDTTVVPPDMLVRLTVREAGTYKLWFQFRGGSSLHVASFVLTAK